MSEGEEKKPPGNVVPFANAIQGAIAEDLRKMYAELVREKLPGDISDLMRQFEELSKKGSDAEKMSRSAADDG
ncbi:MAG: NepR family anti-sigma factor [Xanthobacteraceae bacterium]